MIELRHLKYFVAVAEELHFSRAARRLHMSQPPLSQQIRLLEDMVGTPLFVRTNRSVALTNAGRDLYERVRPWLVSLDAMTTRARRIGDGEQGVLRIGCSYTTTHRLLPGVLKRFQSTYPKVSLSVLEDTGSRHIEALAQGLIDVAFVRLPHGEHGFAATPLYQESLVCVMPPDHALGEFRELRVTDLQGQTFLNASRVVNDPFQSPASICARAGFMPDVSDVSNNANTAVALAGAGMGIALVPESMTDTLPPTAIARPLVDGPVSTVGLLHVRESASSTVPLFVDIAVAVANLRPHPDGL